MTPTDDDKQETPKTPDAEEPAEPEAAEPEPPPPAGEEPEGPQLPPLDVYAVLRISIGQLAAVAWQLMGLQPDPFTNKVHKDIEQARIAIDAAAALADKLLPHLQGQEARDCRTLLTDLRLNFVKQAGEPDEPQPPQ